MDIEPGTPITIKNGDFERTEFFGVQAPNLDRLIGTLQTMHDRLTKPIGDDRADE